MPMDEKQRGATSRAQHQSHAHGHSNGYAQTPSGRSPNPPSYEIEGFANVARWIARDSDNETFIYRKFDELSARNILYLQAELLVLERQLARLDKADSETDDMDLKDAIRTWETLTRRCENGNDKAKVRMDMIVKIREKLKEYHEALLLQAEIARLNRPDKRVLDTYRQWFKQPFPVLGGQSKTFLDAGDDLVALRSSPDADYLSLLLRKHWPAKQEISRDGLHRIGRFEEKYISLAIAVIDIVVAALLLAGPITALYFVNSDPVKLGMIAAFTAAFAVAVSLVTNARRVETFAATAAYAAVLVVFVSGSISNSQSQQ